MDGPGVEPEPPAASETALVQWHNRLHNKHGGHNDNYLYLASYYMRLVNWQCVRFNVLNVFVSGLHVSAAVMCVWMWTAMIVKIYIYIYIYIVMLIILLWNAGTCI